jgi:hypothetical protein
VNAFAGKKDPHRPKQFIPEYQHTEAKGNRKVHLESWLLSGDTGGSADASEYPRERLE